MRMSDWISDVCSSDLNYGSVESVLSGIGARYQRAGEAGKPALLVSFLNNRKAVLMFGSCNADGSACKALSIQSFWTKIAKTARKSVVQGKRVSVRVDLGGRRLITKKINKTHRR